MSDIRADDTVPVSGEIRVSYVVKVFAVVIAILIAMPFLFYPPFAMQLLCYGLFAASVGLLLGYGGLLSFGHAAYFGLSGYVCAHALKVWELSPLVGILLGVCTAVTVGAVIGALAIRRQGIYFSMVTLAFAQMIYFFCVRAEFTGAEDGIQSVPRGQIFGLPLSDDGVLYTLVAVVFLLAMMFIYRVVHSPFGEVLVAIREHEPRATSLGYRTNQYKLLLFVMSAGLAAVAGAMKSIVTQLASLSDVHWLMSGDAVLMTILGGTTSIFGPVLGAIVVMFIKVNMAWAGAWVTVIQGAIFVVCVLTFRQGIVGLFKRWLKI